MFGRTRRDSAISIYLNATREKSIVAKAPRSRRRKARHRTETMAGQRKTIAILAFTVVECTFILIDRSSIFLRPDCPLCEIINFLTGCFVATRAQNRAESRGRLDQSPFGFELKIPTALPTAAWTVRTLELGC